MAAERRTDRREGTGARLVLLPWSGEAEVGWGKGLGRQVGGEDQALVAVRGKGDGGCDDSQVPNQGQDSVHAVDWSQGRRGPCTAPSARVPSHRSSRCLGTTTLLTRRQAVCRGVTFTAGHGTSVLSPPLPWEVGHGYRKQPMFIEPRVCSPPGSKK